MLSVLLFVFSIGTVLKLRSSGRGKHETGRLKSLPGKYLYLKNNGINIVNQGINKGVPSHCNW